MYRSGAVDIQPERADFCDGEWRQRFYRIPLGKGTAHLGHRPRVISLTDNVSAMTAWSNDACYEDVFVEQLKGLVNPGDLVIGISASGNSENVLRAIRHANAIGCKTISWTGFGGGKLRKITDVSVIVDSYDYGPVEDVHLMLNHILCKSIMEEIISENLIDR